MVLFLNTTLIPSSSTSATILHEEVMDVPTVNDDNLRVELVSSGLDFPTSMAFLGPEDILVLEKNEGTGAKGSRILKYLRSLYWMKM